jgi:hypothetical protein
MFGRIPNASRHSFPVTASVSVCTREDRSALYRDTMLFFPGQLGPPGRRLYELYLSMGVTGPQIMKPAKTAAQIT